MRDDLAPITLQEREVVLQYLQNIKQEKTTCDKEFIHSLRLCNICYVEESDTHTAYSCGVKL